MKKIFFMGIVMGLLGCVQTTSNYYYVSLERVADIEVVKHAKLRLKNLEKNTEIPTEHVLIREGYSLRFLIDDKSYSPHLKITAIGVDDNLFLNPKRDINVVSNEGNICASYYLNNDVPSMMDFAWAVNCIEENIDKILSFDMVDSFGAVIGKENIPFTVEHDGEYTLLDAI